MLVYVKVIAERERNKNNYVCHSWRGDEGVEYHRKKLRITMIVIPNFTLVLQPL